MAAANMVAAVADMVAADTAAENMVEAAVVTTKSPMAGESNASSNRW
jgi:hypothetical protein